MQRGIVFDIEHYAVHDGPGIRTVVFLKGCPLECLWCCNPESQSLMPELRHIAAKCRSCFECEKACKSRSISQSGGIPVFDRRVCRACDALCADVCPQGALALVGESTTSEEVIARVAADKAFYDNSGGGVTFSGGEPFAQPTFLEELLDRSKHFGIHTAVETCGQADPRTIARCEPLVDLFLYDLKVIDRQRHEMLTGASNLQILRNVGWLAANASRKLMVRVPVVPGCTDDRANLEALAGFVRSLGITKVQLMPYHALGSDKYPSFGRSYGLAGTASLTAEAFDRAVRLFSTRGVACNTEED